MSRSLLSRDDATLQGAKRYYTGQPCGRGHVAERFTSNGACVDCANRKLPSKTRTGFVGPNSAWPTRAIVFSLPGKHTLDEMQAAIAYAEHAQYLDRALYEVKADPALLARFMPAQRPEDIGAADFTLRREQERQAALAAARTVKPDTD